MLTLCKDDERRDDMTENNQKQLGKTLWAIAGQMRGAMNADDFRDYMLAFLFLRYLSDNYEEAAKMELGRDYPKIEGDDRRVPLAVWYANNPNRRGLDGNADRHSRDADADARSGRERGWVRGRLGSVAADGGVA